MKEETKTLHTKNIRFPSTALIITAVFFSLLPFSAVLLKERTLLNYEKAYLGQIYRKMPDQAEEIAALLFQTEITDETVRAGEEALTALAYTGNGFTALKERIRCGELLFSVISGFLFGSELILLFYLFGKRYREDMQEKNQEAFRLREQLSSLSALSRVNTRLREFTENIAHQIKTPLSRVMTTLELLQEEAGKTEAPRPLLGERAGECVSHIESIRTLTDRLLTIGRLEAGEVVFNYEPFSLSLLLEEAVSAYPAESRAELILEPPEDEFICYGSPAWIQEAFINLLDNAEKYGVSGKAPELSLEALPEAYRITLRDYGPGFSETDLPQLFDRFYRAREMKKGHVGLGLNLVRLIIEGHKGTVRAENAEGGGALFTILLPRYELMK